MFTVCSPYLCCHMPFFLWHAISKPLSKQSLRCQTQVKCTNEQGLCNAYAALYIQESWKQSNSLSQPVHGRRKQHLLANVRIGKHWKLSTYVFGIPNIYVACYVFPTNSQCTNFQTIVEMPNRNKCIWARLIVWHLLLLVWANWWIILARHLPP